MKRRVIAVPLFLGLTLSAMSQGAPLTSLAAVHQLSNEQAAAHVTADFDATVTFYRPYESTMFVQDGDVAIFLEPTHPYPLALGDRIHIHGTTYESFRPFIGGATLTFLHHGAPPAPLPASFDDLIHARLDCKYVRLRGRVLSADVTVSSGRPSTNVQLLLDGGTAEVQIESDSAAALPGLLDAEVEVSGAASGRFDGKMQMTGIVIHVQSMAGLKVVKAPPATPWSAPLTPMGEILSHFRENRESTRVRVQGTVTYFVPGSAVVLQHGSRSLWVETRSLSYLWIGQQVDATGFPDVHDGFLRLADGEVLASQVSSPVQPVPVTWRDLTQSHHVFDLVSIEGEVVAEVREAAQDEYVLVSDGHLYSAIFRHTGGASLASAAPAPMKHIQPGSRVRVDGICILEDSNPFNADVPFDLLLRSVDDITVVARPSPLTVGNLVRMVGLLLIMVMAVFAWGWMLKRKVQRQTAALARRIEAEAATERYNAQIEQRRSRILEDINGSRALSEVLEEIAGLVSFRLQGAPCWCEITEGARLGSVQVVEGLGRRMVREEIPSRTGPPLGFLCVALPSGSAPGAEEEQALFQGTRLATLAIETRKLYSDLVHRSEFDLLTDVHNRFSLDQELEALIARAREHAGIFGLIYVDLDEFKQVNDLYGHQVGDRYLQEVSSRMKRQLRAGDLLARLGGDEFAALVPSARSRAGVAEIASRLERCFDEPFHLDGYVLRGSASIGIALYPEDGGNRDTLLTAADAAMYVAKHTRAEGSASKQ
jgi:diguanylate cyclase (GGDEF)-like protein